MTTLAFFHGWGTSGAVWGRQAQAFEGKFEILAPDLASWDAEWLRRFLAGLHLPETILVGWSLGGMLLTEALARAAGPLPRGLVLVGAAASFCRRSDYPWGQPAAKVRAMRRVLREEPSRVLADFAGTCLAPGEEAFASEARAAFQTPAAVENLAAGLDFLVHQDLRELLPQVPPGVTIIQGEGDAVVPQAQAHYLHQHMPGSRLHLLKGAGHLPFMTQAGAFSRILREICGEGPGS